MVSFALLASAVALLAQAPKSAPGATTASPWLRPSAILGGRLFKFGAQIDVSSCLIPRGGLGRSSGLSHRTVRTPAFSVAVLT